MRALRKLFKADTGREACVAAIAKATTQRRDADRHIAVLILKPVQLENIYASLGHSAGVGVMSSIEADTRKVLAEDDIVLTLDDSKLAVILSSLKHPNHALLAANKIRNASNHSIELSGRNIALRLRVGVAVMAPAGQSPEAALQCAEMALREADETEQPVVMRGEPDSDPVLRNWEIENGLSAALSNGDLEMFYQPKIAVGTLEVCGAEGLLRWEKEGITPDVFIAVAEATHQITALTRFALQSAMRQLAEWPDALGNVGVAVNLSVTDLNNEEFPGVVNGALQVWGIEPERITLEVTETALMEDPDKAHAILNAVRDMGCRVSIDDFGTGYSSLAYFKNIPADELKIDKSFVSNMLTDAADKNIVGHVIDLAHSFGMKVVAEGVEDRETMDCLREMDCDYAQGYYFSKALPSRKFVEWVGEFRQESNPK